MRYYYVATLAGLLTEGTVDAGIVEASGLAHARTVAEGEVGTNHPNAVVIELEVRPAKEESCVPSS